MKTIPVNKIDQLFVEWNKPDSPGFSLAIVKNGKIIFKRGYGMASLEHNIPISTTSVFDIGSTSKQFVAFCVAVLASEGKLSLEDDIQRHIPEMSRYQDTITIRHLIHHISGIRDYLTLMELTGMRLENEYPDEEIIGLISRQKALNFKPGKEFLYSNSGYLLLGEIVKRVSGQSLRDFAEENIFSPLGMKNTHFHDDFSMIVKNKATGYSSGNQGFKIDMSIFDVVGDGGVNTTTEDLFLWDQNFYHNKLGGGGQNLIKEITTPGRLNNGAPLDYAFGLFVTSYRGIKMISHGGSWAGYRAEMLRLPQRKFSVICLSNLGNTHPTQIAKQIVDLCLAGDFAEKTNKPHSTHTRKTLISLPAMENKSGFYVNSKNGGVAEILVKDGKMILGISGTCYPLDSVSLNHFVATANSFDIKFERSKPKKPFQLVARKDGGRPDVYHKMDPVTINLEKLKAFAGEYYCDELDTVYKVTLEDGKLQLIRQGNVKELLRLVCEDLFTGIWITLRFIGDSLGRHTGFYIGAGRVKNLFFAKTPSKPAHPSL
ncbi:MAG TPA: penicillin-binding protein [Elusimicrobia bacterium]|nr:penicillin-binding protein [Elusimicrobiota bacterium]